MKTNKKAILGMLVAMVMSMGVMQGVNANKQSVDSNLQQAAAVICTGGSFYVETRGDQAMMTLAGAGAFLIAGIATGGMALLWL